MTEYWVHNDLKCPSCFTPIPVSGCADESRARKPRENDLSVCSSCLSYLRFSAVAGEGGALKLVFVDRDEFESLSEKDQIALINARAVQIHLQKQREEAERERGSDPQDAGEAV